ncbi:MAG: hypothetical protein ACKOW8_12375 [Flavobacteriales bacterium]
MRKFAGLILFIALSHLMGYSQSSAYTFSPTDSMFCPLSLEAYAENIIYVQPQSADTSFITWRLIENTCPEGWDIQMCDWQNCYTGVPNSSNMAPVPPGGSGNLRLLVNPFLIEGSGLMHFFVYPTGFPDLRQDVYFSFSTPLKTLSLNNPVPIVFFANQHLSYRQLPAGEYDIISVSGSRIKKLNTFSSSGDEYLNLSSGIYILTNRKNIAIQFLIP